MQAPAGMGRVAGRNTLRAGLLAAAMACLPAASPRAQSGVVGDEPPGMGFVIVNAAQGADVAPAAPLLRWYIDAARRFRVAVPAGWSVRKETGSSEVTLLRGDATVSISVDPLPAGVEADGALLDRLLDGYQADIGRHCQATFSDRVARDVAGLPGRAFTAVCTGPMKPTSGQFAAAAAGNQVVVLNVVVPTEDIPRLNAAILWTIVSLQVGPEPRQRPQTPEALQRWVEFVKDACRAGVFSQIQCSVRLAEALRDAAGSSPAEPGPAAPSNMPRR